MMEWYKPSPPGKILPQPWLSPEATDYLASILAPEMTVLEHGAGGSTLWLAERVKQVIAVEHNPDWFATLKEIVPSNVTLVYRDKAGIPGVILDVYAPFDLALIDGEPVEHRAEYIRSAPQLVHPGGWLVLDNANRPEYAGARGELMRVAEPVKRIDGNPAPNFKFLVTEFYRMIREE
jgi:predicted O-methyltransferase YrrM